MPSAKKNDDSHDNNHLNNEGFVKKLLFPAYSNAGASENFLPISSSPMRSSSPLNNNDVESQASTNIMDNRTSTQIQQQQQQQQQQQRRLGLLPRNHKTGTATATTPQRYTVPRPSQTTIGATTTTTTSTSSYSTTTGLGSTAAITTDGFFHNTKPLVPPVSPPKVSRVSMPPIESKNSLRTLSTTAVVEHARLEENNNDNDDHDNDGSFVKSLFDKKKNDHPEDETEQTTSPVRFITHNSYDDEEDEATDESFTAMDQRHTSLMDDGEDDSLTNKHSNSQEENVETPSFPASSFGKQFLLDRIMKPKKYNNNNMDDNNHPKNCKDDDQDEEDYNNDDDVLSTCSERGTVIEESSHRMRDVLDVLDFNDIQNEDFDDATNNHSTVVPAVSSGGSTHYATPPEDEAKREQRSSPTLEFPILSSFENQNNKLSEVGVDNDLVKPSTLGKTPSEDVPAHLLRPRHDSNMIQDEKKLPDDCSPIQRQPQDHGNEYMDDNDVTYESFQKSHQSHTTSSLLTAAIRKFTSGSSTSYVGPKKPMSNIHRDIVSAPTTPCPYNYTTTPSTSSTTPRSSTMSPSKPPTSFLLRSPGSLAFQSASKNMNKKASVSDSPSSSSSSSLQIPQLAPRFRKFEPRRHQIFMQRFQQNHSQQHEDANDQPLQEDRQNQASKHQPTQAHQSNNPFQVVARSCFSFDGYDTTMDDQYEVDYHKHPRQHRHFRDNKGNVPNEADKDTAKITASYSWDGCHEQRTTTLFRPRTAAGADRGGATLLPQTSMAASPKRHTLFRPAALGHTSRDGDMLSHQATAFSSSPKQRRVRIASDFTVSPSHAQALRTPQRIEIEREDALDILACLVERGISWKQPDDVCKDEVSGVQGNDGGLSRSRTPSLSDMEMILKELQELSLAEENLSDFHSHSDAHRLRKAALEELWKSHQYALEMKRASQSASLWLESIGRRPSNTLSFDKSEQIGKINDPDSSNNLEMERTFFDGEPRNVVDACDKVEHPPAIKEQSNADQSIIDALTFKAMLHSAQMEIEEKSNLAQRLNEELAKCRAEIGRLSLQATNSAFRSPNRSILDESDDISVTEADNEDEEEESELERSFESHVVGDDCQSTFKDDPINTPFLRHGENDPTTSNGLDCKSSIMELSKYKLALDEANAKIRELHSRLKDHKLLDEGSSENAPVVVVCSKINVDLLSRDQVSRLKEKSVADGKNESEKDVMVDGDDFVTQWDELVPSLADPPDHEVRSPIVNAVLESWTHDRGLQETLLAWIDGVLDVTTDPESIAPLTITNLDSQLRDGFAMRVLPLLLRRPDIRVDVRTRLHRRTSYDLSVMIDRASAPSTSVPQSRLLESVSVRNAAPSCVDDARATTEILCSKSYPRPTILTNLNDDRCLPAPSSSSRVSYDEMAEDMTVQGEAATGVLSTLGGALGGLFRKGESSNVAVTSTASLPAVLEQIDPLVEADDPPYHRVVTAPPGRIGVTFVEFRGHCMVSDVHDDSPLKSWIFPSDILIAIDETAVSGMRIREIIDILKNKVDYPRALRIVSSHAMQEFTANTSMVAADEGN